MAIAIPAAASQEPLTSRQAYRTYDTRVTFRQRRAALRDEDTLRREDVVRVARRIVVRAAVADLNRAELPDRALARRDGARHERVRRGRDLACRPDRRIGRWAAVWEHRE